MNTVADMGSITGLDTDARGHAAAWFFNVALLIAVFLGALLLLASASLILGGRISSFQVMLAAAVMAIAAFAVAGPGSARLARMLTGVVAVCALAAVSVVVAGSLYDLSFDGQAIHQEAILQLAAGWNPYHDRLAPDTPHAIWIEHYAKGVWLQAAAVYSLTGRIETGKAINLMLIAQSWLFVGALLMAYRRVPVWLVLVLAALAAFNPVSVYQASTYYVDGQLASLFLSMLALIGFAMRGAAPRVLIAIAAVIFMMVNVKFTGLVYAVMLCGALAAMALYLWGWRSALKNLLMPAAGGLIGVLVVGFNPYVTNTLTQGHPFYPLLGEGAIDIMAHAKPEPLQSMNRIQALSTSLFSVSSNSRTSYQLKLPFRPPSRGELNAFSGHDPRLGGWGPWFGAMLTLALPLAVLIFIKCPSRAVLQVTGFIIAVLAVTVLANPEAWWARYTPQLYFLPLTIVVACLACFSGSLRVFGLLVAAVATLNCAMVLLPQAKGSIEGTLALSRQIDVLRKEGRPLTVFFSLFAADRARLDEADIRYTTVLSREDLPCADPVVLTESADKVMFCVAR